VDIHDRPSLWPSDTWVMCRRAALWALGVWLLSPVGSLWAVGEKGNILFEYWDGLTSDIGSIDVLVNDPRWPDSPTSDEWRIKLQGAVDRADEYGTRVRGYVYPPQTGDYTFWIASDDSSELWLSTSETPNGASKIAYVNGYTAALAWTTFPSQKSAARRLEAGKRYYVEVRHVDGSGDDNLAVGWFGPGVTGSTAARPMVIDGKYLSAYIREKDMKATGPVPVDGADDVSPQPAIVQWTPGYGATRHDLYLGTRAAQLEFIGRLTTPGYLSAEEFVPGQRYFWRVDEVETDGKTVYTGDLWSFKALPYEASLPDPIDGAKGVMVGATLSWRAGVRGVVHHVYLGTDRGAVENAGAAAPEYKGVTFGDMTRTQASLEENATYYWRVDEDDSKGTTFKGSVWKFRTFAPEPQENLVGYWKFDEGRGTTAADYSGLGSHADLINGVAWAQGYFDGAIDLDGTDDYVSLPIGDLIASQDSITVAAWVNCTNTTDTWQRIFDFGSSTTVNMFLTPRSLVPNLRFAITVAGSGGESQANASGALATDWHYVAAMIDGPAGQMSLWLDGVSVASASTAVLPSALGVTTNNWIGRSQYSADPYLAGRIDDFRVYDTALTVENLAKVMRGDARLAWGPSPAIGGQTDVELASLTWIAGEGAVGHDVYLGTDSVGVEDADAADTTGIYRGRQTATAYALQTLQADQVCYWRIDEVMADGTVVTGTVWRFTVADYLIVDDFEQYDDVCNRIFFAWVDGFGYSGSPDCGIAPSNGNGTASMVGNTTAPFAERTSTYSGRQAMPVVYDNSAGQHCCETQREWAVPQDWTRKGMKALSLEFYGDGANTVAGLDNLYVAIKDSSGNTAAVQYDGSPHALRQAGWHEFDMDLRSFAGVNLAAVKTLILGIGDWSRSGAQAGGKGRVVIDAIRLYPPRCMPAKSGLAGDLNGDCVVDWKDLKTLCAAWLATGQWIQPQDQGKASGQWKLDGNAVESFSGVGGSVAGPVAAAGIDGLAMKFSTEGDYIDLGSRAGEIMSALDSFTMSIWANPDLVGGAWQRLFDLGNSDQDYVFVSLCRGSVGGSGPRYSIRVAGGTEQLVDSTKTLTGAEWNHVAATLDASARLATLYINGEVSAQNTSVTFRPKDIGVTKTNYLGRSHYLADFTYRGLLDDFRIYSRALIASEVLSLGKVAAAYEFDGTAGRADLNVDGTVNGKDFATLAHSWMTRQLWP